MKTKNILFYLIVAAMLASCTERVDFDLEEAGEPMLVVFGEITSDEKQHEIKLGKSAPYFYNKPPETVSGAVVTVNDGNNTISLTEDAEKQGTYLTPKNYAGKTGRNYRLDISNVDINEDGTPETYWAETEMKAVPPIHAVQVVYNSMWDGWEVRLFSEDQAETDDYYLFKVYKNGILYTDSIHNYWTMDDRFFNGDDINGPMAQYFDEEKGELVEKGDTITLEMAGITKAYYDYVNGVLLETREKVPLFSGPSVNLKGNISNGALGFFAVMEVERKFVVYDGEARED